MTFAETHSPDRYSYFIRLWNEDDDELELEYHDFEWEAAEEVDKLMDDPDSIVNRGGKWTHYDLVKLDWWWHSDEVIDGGDF